MKTTINLSINQGLLLAHIMTVVNGAAELNVYGI